MRLFIRSRVRLSFHHYPQGASVRGAQQHPRHHRERLFLGQSDHARLCCPPEQGLSWVVGCGAQPGVVMGPCCAKVPLARGRMSGSTIIQPRLDTLTIKNSSDGASLRNFTRYMHSRVPLSLAHVFSSSFKPHHGLSKYYCLFKRFPYAHPHLAPEPAAAVNRPRPAMSSHQDTSTPHTPWCVGRLQQFPENGKDSVS